MSTFRRTTAIIDKRIFLSDEDKKVTVRNVQHTNPLNHMTKRELFDYSVDYQLTDDDIVTKIKQTEAKNGFVDSTEVNRIWRLHYTAIATNEIIHLNRLVLKNIEYLRGKFSISEERFNKTMYGRFGIHMSGIKERIESGHTWDDLTQMAMVARVLGVDPIELITVDIEKRDKTFL